MERVGVRELRQNLSVYLRRVQDGQTLEVTERGRPVAVLGPLPETIGILERLEVEGRLSKPKGDLRELLPPPGKPDPGLSRRLHEALEEQRADTI
jgi:prevent-host-death family protein